MEIVSGLISMMFPRSKKTEKPEKEVFSGLSLRSTKVSFFSQKSTPQLPFPTNTFPTFTKNANLGRSGQDLPFQLMNHQQKMSNSLSR